jgi:hypothetical protein
LQQQPAVKPIAEGTMDLLRASLLIGLCVTIGMFNAKIANERTAILIWSQQADDHWTRQCTYYFPFRLINRPVPLEASCPKQVSP